MSVKTRDDVRSVFRSCLITRTFGTEFNWIDDESIISGIIFSIFVKLSSVELSQVSFNSSDLKS